MRTLLFALLFVFGGTLTNSFGQEVRASDLTANDLAEVLGVHWWTVKIPANLGSKDTVGIELFASDGKKLGGGGAFSGVNLGSEVRIFCYEEKSEKLGIVVIRTKGGTATFPIEDYFRYGGVGGASNGSVLHLQDTLIKFSKEASFNGGNELLPGQVGMRVVVTRRP